MPSYNRDSTQRSLFVIAIADLERVAHESGHETAQNSPKPACLLRILYPAWVFYEATAAKQTSRWSVMTADPLYVSSSTLHVRTLLGCFIPRSPSTRPWAKKITSCRQPKSRHALTSYFAHTQFTHKKETVRSIANQSYRSLEDTALLSTQNVGPRRRRYSFGCAVEQQRRWRTSSSAPSSPQMPTSPMMASTSLGWLDELLRAYAEPRTAAVSRGPSASLRLLISSPVLSTYNISLPITASAIGGVYATHGNGGGARTLYNGENAAGVCTASGSGAGFAGVGASRAGVGAPVDLRQSERASQSLYSVGMDGDAEVAYGSEVAYGVYTKCKSCLMQMTRLHSMFNAALHLQKLSLDFSDALSWQRQQQPSLEVAESLSSPLPMRTTASVTTEHLINEQPRDIHVSDAMRDTPAPPPQSVTPASNTGCIMAHSSLPRCLQASASRTNYAGQTTYAIAGDRNHRQHLSNVVTLSGHARLMPLKIIRIIAVLVDHTSAPGGWQVVVECVPAPPGTDKILLKFGWEHFDVPLYWRWWGWARFYLEKIPSVQPGVTINVSALIPQKGSAEDDDCGGGSDAQGCNSNDLAAGTELNAPAGAIAWTRVNH
ncbi:hypothetical protein BDN71DRAFT_1435974 [Pleurotus eryngii]|uniref:Uncharacterized protein n=1 Tax=Pleurotus eryngii TaxID=5323 RepID=A0A9P5ZLA1_PLEER|nr:hypothetical protein BDN71DRAFT_1435974 [Pleurotus eryngii]